MKVAWNENACCHSGNCVRALPQVFAIENGHFVIRPEKAAEDDIRAVVDACPGQALSVPTD